MRFGCPAARRRGSNAWWIVGERRGATGNGQRVEVAGKEADHGGLHAQMDDAPEPDPVAHAAPWQQFSVR
jgi:hypothetical protein